MKKQNDFCRVSKCLRLHNLMGVKYSLCRRRLVISVLCLNCCNCLVIFFVTKIFCFPLLLEFQESFTFYDFRQDAIQ